jgi:hypothetical protein
MEEDRSPKREGRTDLMECSTVLAHLYDYRRHSQPSHHSIAERKVSAARRSARRERREEQVLAVDTLLEPGIVSRIRMLQISADDRDGPSAGGESCAMGCHIDPGCEP